MNLVPVFTVILLAAASALCISLIVYLNRISRSIKNIEAEVRDLSSDVKPLLSSTTELSDKLNHISEEAGKQLNTTKNIVAKVDDRIDTILLLEERFRSIFEGSILDFLKNISAIASGVNAFWNAYKKK